MQWRCWGLVVAAAAGCGGPAPSGVGAGPPPKTPLESAPRSDDPASIRVTRFLGLARTAVLMEAASIESYRIQPEEGGAAPAISGHPVIRRGPDLTAAQAAAVRAVISDPGSYRFDTAKECEFEPGVALRFVQGERRVDLLLCFSCDEWRFVLDGRGVFEDFDGARPALVALVQQLFPGDAAIRKLRATRRSPR